VSSLDSMSPWQLMRNFFLIAAKIRPCHTIKMSKSPLNSLLRLPLFCTKSWRLKIKWKIVLSRVFWSLEIEENFVDAYVEYVVAVYVEIVVTSYKTCDGPVLASEDTSAMPSVASISCAMIVVCCCVWCYTHTSRTSALSLYHVAQSLVLTLSVCLNVCKTKRAPAICVLATYP
jgi:hypothetical protein